MITDRVSLVQLPLFNYGEPAENIVELLPLIWESTEALVAQDAVVRQHGIDALIDMGAQRASPLVAFMIAKCINDPDIYIRRRVVYILADILNKTPAVKQPTNEIRETVSNYLRKMGEETIYGLLEVAVMDPQVESSIYQIFISCPSAGKSLSTIISEWNHPLRIRQKAIEMVGLVGYLEAYPTLQRLLDRMEARQDGQYAMSFVPASIKSDEDIIPYLRAAILQLKSQ
jgi:HEAT repeat protein